MRIIALLICLLLFPSILLAETQEEKRRVEQEKREELQPSEIHVSEEAKAPAVSKPPIDTIDIVYFAELLPKRVTFGYDACKALVILFRVENEHIDLNSQVAFLKERRLLPKKYESEFDPMQPLRRGLVAYIFCRALEIKGGIILGIFGISQRYAIKELAFQGIMSSGNVQDIVSGDELVSILTQAIDYMAKKE